MSEIVKLQDLEFIAGKKHGGRVSAEAEQARQRVQDELSHAEADISAFVAKIYPQGVDVVCSFNNLVSRNGRRLYFKGSAVRGEEMTCDDCIEVSKRVKDEFAMTLNTMATALKTGVSGDALARISQDLCRKFNTLTYFLDNLQTFRHDLSERVLASFEGQADDNADDGDKFSEVISIPIGRNTEREVDLNLSSRKLDAHAVISGISGSGKSSLLQSIILGGAYKYSPDRLQFWVMDFKEGTGLMQFKWLKHVKVMSLKNRPIDANEIMDMIKSEYKRRAELIAKDGGGDICTYNAHAMAQGREIMSRLIIIIDEFTLMHHSCFTSLSDTVRVGRSMGMSFILCSQLIETSESYGSAVKQATHLFEFANHDSALGRLVKNVTEAERKYVSSGEEGKCIYRNDPNRVSFRVAYAGGVDAQTEFIKEINDKWSDYAYVEPIVTGQPERKLRSIESIKVDARSVKDEFVKNKQALIPIGESRVGEKYLYKVNRNNPLLVIFGDETRVASVELSVIEHFKVLSREAKAVYYLDMNCNYDRAINAVTDKYSVASDDIRYVNTDDGIRSAIDEVYGIMQSRKRTACNDKSKDIGNPIEIIVHNAERIAEFKQARVKRTLVGMTRQKPAEVVAGRADMDFDEFDALRAKSLGTASGDKPIRPSGDEQDDKSTFVKLREIIESGNDYRIFVMLYFDQNRSQSVLGELFSYNFNFKDALVVPRIPDYYEELSYSEVTDCLKSCRLQAPSNGDTRLEQSDFICAVLVDDKVLHKIIPYEWKPIR